MSWIGSPNYTQGRQGTKIDRVYIHWMVGTLESTDSVFQNKAVGTSAHYGIENGNIHQYVGEENTAYHAGTWSENLRSVGIEHSAAPGRDATQATLETSARLIAEICKRHGIPIDRAHIRKHSENIATQCPGTIPIDWLVARAKQIKKGGIVRKIVNAANWRWRMQRLHWQLVGNWDMSDAVFQSIVGQDPWTVVESWSDHPNANQTTEFQRIGQKAVQDKWQQQIYDLQARVKALGSRPTKAQLDAANTAAEKLSAQMKDAQAEATQARKDAAESRKNLEKIQQETEQAEKEANNFLTALINAVRKMFGKSN